MIRKASPPDPFSGVTMDRIHTFRAVAAQGGIAAAVRALQSQGRRDRGAPAHVQSQFSRQIAALEEALGAKLFERDARGFQLTSRGRELEEASASWMAALEAIRTRSPDEPVELTLAAGDSLLGWLVVPRLASFLAATPRLRITLRASATPIEEVEAGRAHFGVGAITRRLPTSYRKVGLGERRYALFVPRSRKTAGLDLRGLLLSGPLARIESAPEPHEAACRVARVWPAVSLACETYAQGARAVAAQTHAAVLPIEAAAELGRSVARVVPLPGGGERVHLVTRRHTLVLADAERLFDRLRRELGEALAPPARS